MRKAFIFSVLFHIGIIVVAVVGLPVGEPLPVEIVETMEVDIAELTVTTKNQKPPREVKEEPKETQTPPPPPPAPKPAPPPEPEAEPAPPEPEQAEPTPPEPEPAPAPPEEPKVAVVTPVAKPRPKPVKKKEADFDNMLNTLKLDEEPVDAPDSSAKKKKDFFDELNLDNIETADEPKPREKTQIATIIGTRLTVSEVDAVRRQFEKCWNVPIGARNPEELVVEIKVRVNRDRSVLDAKIVDQARMASDTFFRAMAESALRAVKSPKCSPLRLPADKYDVWKEMTVVFDPSGMVGR